VGGARPRKRNKILCLHSKKIAAILPDVRVLLSSGYSIDSQAKDILARGCDAFIQKPFGMRELSQKIREVLQKK
jgi:DNA-binding NarL/FixJ family response regulator